MQELQLHLILDFFREIKLPFELVQLGNDTFMSGMTIAAGALSIDPGKLLHPGDLLHEAGHIAVTPADLRGKLTGDVKQAGHKGGEEMAAIAWSWAALKYIGLEPEVLFHPDGYKGASQSLIDAFSESRGFGYPLLSAWGMCTPNGYPQVTSWLRK